MNTPLFSGCKRHFFQLKFLFIEIIADLHAIVGNSDPSVWDGELSKIHDSSQ